MGAAHTSKRTSGLCRAAIAYRTDIVTAYGFTITPFLIGDSYKKKYWVSECE